MTESKEKAAWHQPGTVFHATKTVFNAVSVGTELNGSLRSGNSSKSSIMEIVAGLRSDLPHANRHVLPEEEVAILNSWINTGAVWQEVDAR